MAKTTLEIADNLILRAKRKALELGRPLRAIVEAALLNYLGNIRGKKIKEKIKKIRWRTVNAGLPGDLDISNRENMYKWLKR